ncbi:DUF72 domain-containing protein [Mucilaginibacter mali]|uniref:DUF72 domain-containing protein n=1 Tax=Mucilaginibacter mali TaxID=2740462 RepID=A0A7D4UFP3_9SPHI|nr:DUF72 domain-containing protein [Mucilaginibacter mali]QKJ30636.1 DUF72 domain-containing protein [Mucilaginibacter mali]
MGTIAKFYSGTSGLVLPVPNKQAFPLAFRERTRLEYYASLFNSIEINSSFYKVPMAATITKWAQSVPENFRFTYKLWRGITHNRGLEFDPGDILRFMNVINNAGDKKGSMLIQFPASIKAGSFMQLTKLLNTGREADPEKEWDIAIEFRDRSWYQDKTYQLLSNLQMGLVLHDIPASATPMVDITTNFVYLRFHGPAGDYRGSYTDDILNEYATYIEQWLADSKTVYAYFNNTIGHAVHNLATLNTFVNAMF